MVTIKCGSCGVLYNLTEANIANHTASDRCPNCKAQIPRNLSGGMGEISKAIISPDIGGWKVKISSFDETDKSTKAEDFLTLK